MPYTVHLPNGTNYRQFEAYVRILRNQGIYLGSAPRVPDPRSDSQWLYVWTHEAQALNFAKELREQTGVKEWTVAEVDEQPSTGPFGPALFLVSSRAVGLYFSIHPLTEATIQSAFPEAVPSASIISIRSENWQRYKAARGGLESLIREIGPNLTGLPESQLEGLGFRVVDLKRGQILVDVAPAKQLQ